MSRIFWILLVATLVAWLMMNLVTVPRIEALAGDLRLLDMRFTGYSFAEAHDFIEAMGDEGAALYLGAQFWLDMIFPPLLGAVLFIVYRRLFTGWLRLIAGAGALAYVVVDVFENLTIAALLRTGADTLTPEMVAAAHLWTVAKWSLALIGLATLFTGLGLRIRRHVLTA